MSTFRSRSLLRLLVLSVGIVGITCAVLTLSRYLRDRDAEAERLIAAVEMIRSSGGVVFTTPADPTSLASVDLSRAKSDAGLLQAICEFARIERLSLAGQRLETEGYRQLFQIAGLKELILDDCSVSDDDCAYLPLGLTNLSLQRTSVSDSGIRHLAKLNSLESLDLANTAVTSGVLGLLESLESLQSLRIDDVCITHDSGHVLQRMELNESNVLITKQLGKESYEILKQSTAENVRGRHVEGYVLWDSASPWAYTLAGVVEAVVTECSLNSEQQSRLLETLASMGNFGPRENQPPQSLVAASWVQMMESSKTIPEIASIQDFIVELQKSFNEAHLKGIRQYARERFTAADIPALLEASRSDFASRESIFRVLCPFLLVQHGMENPEVVEELDRLLGQKSTFLATIYAFGSGGSAPFYSPNEYEPSQAADAFAVTRLLKIAGAENRSELAGDACVILAEIAHRRPEYAPSILPVIIESLSIANSAWQREAGRHLSRIAKAAPHAAADMVPRLRVMLAQIDQQGSEIRDDSPQVNDPTFQRHRNAVLESLSAIATASPEVSKEIALDYLSRLQKNKVAGPFAPLLSLENPDVTCSVVSELLRRRSNMTSELHSVAIAIRDLRSLGDD